MPIYDNSYQGNVYAGNRHRPPLKASGNVNYRQFIALVQYLWKRKDPRVPIVPTQGNRSAKLPCIVYSLEVRKPHDHESKPKLREEKNFGGKKYWIYSQRFINIVSFSVITQNNPEQAEAIIEEFEDFMQEQIPVLKEAGVSEFLYSRRLSDREINQRNEDVEYRTVSYAVTLQKTYVTEVEKLNQIIIDVRQFLAHNTFTGIGDIEAHATPVINIVDTNSATPSY